MHAEKSGMCSPNGCVHPEQGGRRVCMVSIRGSRAAPSSVHRRGRRPTVQPPQHVTSTHARCRQQAHGGVVGPEQDISVPRNTGKWGWCMKASSSLTQMHASSSSNTDAESERPPFLRERIAARPDMETPRPPAERCARRAHSWIRVAGRWIQGASAP
jgi:hypothetical protein